MNEPSCIVCAVSRLHADIIMIRLRRVGISGQRISALFLHRCMPNAAACWLSLPQDLCIEIAGETLMGAGPMGAQLADAPAAVTASDLLQEVGCEHRAACAVEDRLAGGRIVLFLHDLDDRDLALVWRVAKETDAEMLAFGSESESAGHLLAEPSLAAAV